VSADLLEAVVDVTRGIAPARHHFLPAAADTPPSYDALFSTSSRASGASDSKQENAVETGMSHGVTSSSAREYRTVVSTRSGSISGTYPLGSNTKLSSRSGSLNSVELVVMSSPSNASKHVETITRDGAQHVRIIEDSFFGPLVATGKKDKWWKGMLALHESQSGSVDVVYPDSWEGTGRAESKSGKVRVVG
jgi:hypothetical protein